MQTIEHWINGASTAGDGERSAPVYNPATGQVQSRVRLAEKSDVDTAVASAKAAFDGWHDLSLAKRTEILFRFRELLTAHTDELAEAITDEHGKTLDDARGEVARGREVVEFACGIPHLLKGAYSDQVSTGVDAWSLRQPLGVCAGITPFNFPAMVPLWMHPIAIAAGNTFVLKPSERDPSAAMVLARLWQRAGLPDGVFTVLHGDAVAVDALLDHPDVAAVSFVGSTPIARHVYQRGTAAGKRVQALGGAKNHAVVLPDADLADTARQITGAAYGSAGQRCMAISAVVAVGDCADDLVAALAELARGVRVGAGRDAGTELGPVITAQAAERIVGHVERAAADGATLVVDRREQPGDGFFVGPCLLDHVDVDQEIYRTEVFGPVLVVLRAATLDEAIALVNANPYGNGAAIFTGSGAAARRFGREVTAGMVGINVPIPVPMAYHSFGGWKDSLFGDTHVYGTEGVAFYTRAKAVTARWPRGAAAPQYHFPSA
ncbi:CoA-acylating methylmalonate-semialdehyde dehydrogenase [Actinocatenispora comari]|uniref:methylmalonate-semialdehyde dehydrogenase (CoA acylating) n=1 Tax=Actinocatenispora comari TaxID=2807577 RepID=A0A8J4EMV8_9ACTN|nr:CoA-acylating methylmalonate-semialdehyde dehydrogenase [Actinocatenispora comari]GIL29976.1 methylmalonate-semialdehyde dehydrogenase (acylating) [Actinocatenispora comari]